MKTKFFVVIAITMLFMTFVMVNPVHAETDSTPTTGRFVEPDVTEGVTDEGLRYTITVYPENTEVVIHGLKEGVSYKTLTIPSEINGKKVTQIEEKAFFGDKTIEKVVFPNQFVLVNNRAFSGCTNLKQVVAKGATLELSAKVFEGSLIEDLDFGSAGFDGNSFSGMRHLKTMTFGAKNGCWIWDNIDGGVDSTLSGEDLEYFRNHVTIYGHSTEDDQTNAVMLTPKGFALKRGIHFVDLDTLEEKTLEDIESSISVWTNVNKLAEIKTVKMDTKSEVYQEMTKDLENYDIALAYDVSIGTKDYKGDIKVTLPVDSKYNGKTALVLHKKADGTIEKITAKAEEGKVTVTLTELSPIVVAFENEVAEEPAVQDKKDTSPKTGVTDVTFVFWAITAMAGAGMVVLKKIK